MPKPDPGRDSLFKYFKHDFPWKKDWNPVNIPNIESTYTYETLKEALKKISKINPEIHKYLSYLVNSGRNRNDIVSYFNCDTSTLKKKCNRGFDMIMNLINNQDAFFDLKPIDLIHQEEY